MLNNGLNKDINCYFKDFKIIDVNKSYNVASIRNNNKEELLNNLIECACVQALDSENKILNKNNLSISIDNILKNYSFCSYYAIKDNYSNIVSSIMLYDEYDIINNINIKWIGNVVVKREYRRKKIFSKIIVPHVIKSIKNESDLLFNKTILKLMVENDNSIAVKAYEKCGFKPMDNIVILGKETNNIDCNNIDKLINYDNNSYNIEEINMYNINELITFILKNNFYNYINKIDLSDTCKSSLYKSVHEVVKDFYKGKFIVIYSNKLNNYIGLFYISYEPSDWKNSLNWYVFNIYVNTMFLDCFNKDIDIIIESMIKYHISKNGKSIRFLSLKDNIKDYNSSCLDIKNYTIYLKDI